MSVSFCTAIYVGHYLTTIRCLLAKSRYKYVDMGADYHHWINIGSFMIREVEWYRLFSFCVIGLYDTTKDGLNLYQQLAVGYLDIFSCALTPHVH